jgi:hypothetical protein
MTRLPEREVHPSRGKRPKRQAPNLGPRLNVSVPISFGLPLVVVGVTLIAAGAASDIPIFLITGFAATVGGVLLFASGKRL